MQATVKRGQALVYYAGAGWTKSGDFPDKQTWMRYISESGAKLNSK